MKQAFLLLFALAMVGCSNSSNGGGGGGNGPGPNGKLTTVSVIGQATQIGVFPDGTPSTKLSQTEMDEISKSTAGALKVSEAVGALSPTPVQTTQSQNVQVAQTFLNSEVAKNLFRLRAATNDIEQFKNELRQNCTIQKSGNQPVKTGDQNNTHLTVTDWSTISGAACPLSSRMDISLIMDAVRTGEKSAYIKGGVDFSSNVKLLEAQDQLDLDFKDQSIGGRLEGQMMVDGKMAEIAANGRLTGILNTTANAMTAEILFDLYGTGPQEQQAAEGSTIVTGAIASVPQNQGTFKLAVVLTNNNVKMLLQVFAETVGPHTVVKAYLNGEELKQVSRN
jgi:hypothetical protein